MCNELDRIAFCIWCILIHTCLVVIIIIIIVVVVVNDDIKAATNILGLLDGT